jgi:dTDP-L-rhamnose 4-epimerase
MPELIFIFMNKKMLISGGAGFIGSHLCDKLLENGYSVRVLDNLSEQVHGADCQRPEYLHRDVELIKGDVRDREAVKRALKGIDVVYHFAASVGVGQSMYEMAAYTDVNNLGTAVFLEALVENPVEKLVVASSMSVYGEGLYLNNHGKYVPGFERSIEDLREGRWELYDGNGEILQPVPTSESKQPVLGSVYALSKYDQEQMCLMIGRAYNIPVVALRFFNVYGTRQALSNPYTGVLAIFASRYLNEKPPVIFEDGNQKRDFVHVMDVARACLLAGEVEKGNGKVINIGSGNDYTINFIAEKLSEVMGKKHIRPDLTGKYRAGDIRHCFADIERARELLGFKPEIELEDGLAELAQWLEGQVAYDKVDLAGQELFKRGLAI